jgi:hypothetical protein
MLKPMNIRRSSLVKKIIRNSCVEVIPGCYSCAYQPYCGADPVRAYSHQKDKTYVGHMPTSEFCKKHKAIISFFMQLIEQNNEEVMDIVWSWITQRKTEEVRLQ